MHTQETIENNKLKTQEYQSALPYGPIPNERFGIVIVGVDEEASSRRSLSGLKRSFILDRRKDVFDLVGTLEIESVSEIYNNKTEETVGAC